MQRIIWLTEKINFIVLCLLTSICIYSLVFVYLFLKQSSVIIFYLPVIIVRIDGALAMLANGVLLSVLMLGSIIGFRQTIKAEGEPTVGNLVPMVFATNMAVAILLRPRPPILLTPAYVPAIVVWAPVYEELFFRFLLVSVPSSILARDPKVFGGKRNVEGHDWILILTSSVVFSIYHIYGGIGLIIMAMVAGIVLGYLCLRYSVLCSMFAHMLLNSLAAGFAVSNFYGHSLMIIALETTAITLAIIGTINMILMILTAKREK